MKIGSTIFQYFRKASVLSITFYFYQIITIRFCSSISLTYLPRYIMFIIQCTYTYILYDVITKMDVKLQVSTKLVANYLL